MSPTTATRAHPLIQVDLDSVAFVADWQHCDHLANYLSRLASFDRADTFFYANLLSTVLNELLEIVFFEHDPEGGELSCTLLRDGAVDRVELLIPVDDQRRGFYERGVEEAQSPCAAEIYTQALLGEKNSRRALGLLELASDYGANVALQPATDGRRLCLSVEVRLEDARSPKSSALP